MKRQRALWMRRLFGVVATTGLVATALGSALMAQLPAEVGVADGRDTVCGFQSGSARIDEHCTYVLANVGSRLKTDPSQMVQIIGYARPTERQDLADRRAQALKIFLVTRYGIDPSRIVTSGEVSSNCDQNKCQTAVITFPSAR